MRRLDCLTINEFADMSQYPHPVMLFDIMGYGLPPDNFPEFKIPEDHYFCMGDNRDNSYDSRYWGPVHKDLMIGKPWRIYWSYKSSTSEYLTPGLWHKIKEMGKTILNFFTKTRWERSLKKIE